MNITEHEMRGLLTGKCLPGDMRVNEELPAYLVRKFTELKESRDSHMQAEMTWERSMMAAIGEDGTGSVAKAIAELKAQRDALAAENGLAAKAVQTFCDVVGSNNDVIAEEMGIEGAKAILAAMSATGNMPATDAYLNSVRAEGADKVAKYHFVRIDALKEVSRQGHLFHKAAYSDAVNVANLFRAGKDGE